ncbi:MAG: hypothetical protein K2X81_24610 [Candidatus Obscuribacterales bacterium]|nr:hypothetical protein [Candidatus Obscuribacterales bacterium]
MPNYFKIAEAAAETLAETKVGAKLAEEALGLMKGAATREGAAELLGSKLALLKTPAAEGLPGRSLKAIVSGFPEEIPETLAAASSLSHELGKLGTVLNPAMDKKVALGMRKLSENWATVEQFPGSSVSVRTASGEMSMPSVFLSPAQPRSAGIAEWLDGTVNMGRAAFRSPFSAETTGIAVHEMTHHEQAFLSVGLAADKLGIKTAAANPVQIQRIMSDVKRFNIGLSETQVQNFLEFRAGRQLSSEGSLRAEKLLSSNQELFDLPFSHQGLNRQLREIDRFQTLLAKGLESEEAKGVLKQFANPTERALTLQRIFGHEATDQAQMIAAQIPSNSLKGSLNAKQYQQLGTIFQRSLERAESSTLQNKMIWEAVYTDALHEREARFNQYIAQQVLTDHLAALHL